ncbi:MAG: metal-dependent hydrolase [Saprospirales bacterium]|nr:metal-dependent hydrolase [Saprospirales bacterium]
MTATVCLEHFTALFGHALFEHVELNQDIVPKDMAELFQWHAAEEIEHKNVAFDVFQKVDKDEHITRVTLMPIVTALLILFRNRNYDVNVSRQKIHETSKTTKAILRFCHWFVF